jgi:hypothetical protein
VHPEEVGTKGERGNNEDRRRERGGFRAGHAETAWVSIVPLKRRGRNTTTVIFIGVALVGKTTSDVIIPVCLHPPRRRNRKKDAFSALLFRIKEKITTPRVTTLQVLGVKVVRRCLIKKQKGAFQESCHTTGPGYRMSSMMRRLSTVFNYHSFR